MKSLFAALVLALVAVACPTWADAPASDCTPWVKAQATFDAAFPEIKAGGIKALASHVDDFEQALAGMDKHCDMPKEGDIVVLTDGMMETIVAMAAAQKQYPGRTVVAVRNPYPLIALFLGSYYNEIRHYEDALRVFDLERASNKGNAGQTRPSLIGERAAALGQLHRLDEALAAYTEGLELLGIDDKGKARMQRGRGYILTEMDRLDEAASAYQESLKLEPGNALAKSELEYIYKLELGSKKAPGGIITVPPQQPKTN